MQYKIILVDDHAMFLDGLKALIDNYSNFSIEASFTNGYEALDFISKTKVDILITDVSMPDINGIEMIKQVKKLHKDIKILVVTMHNETGIIKSVMKEKPNGLISKNTNEKELQLALETIIKEETFYSSFIQNIINDAFQGKKTKASYNIIPALSKREKEVLVLISQQYTTPEIADKLFLSFNTIETYRQNLLQKLGAKNSPGIVAKAYELGLLS